MAVDQLLAALSRQKTEIPVSHNGILLVYQEQKQEEAIRQAIIMREQGHQVSLVKWQETKTQKDYQSYARRMNMTEIQFLC